MRFCQPVILLSRQVNLKIENHTQVTVPYRFRIGQVPKEHLAVCAGGDEEGLLRAPGADVDVGGLLVAGERDPRQQLHLSRRLCKQNK